MSECRIIVTNELLSRVRAEVRTRLGDARFRHTEGVEREVEDLSALLLPNETGRLRIAALLHDITKEVRGQAQIDLCLSLGISLTEEELASPAILHAKSGAEVAKRDFAYAVDDGIIRAISLHTTGDAQMTLFDEILFLADYIEAGRTYDDCRRLRAMFWDADEKTRKTLSHFHAVLLSAFEMTIADLQTHGRPIVSATLRARDILKEKCSQE